jgi:hypothetical protein
MVAMVSAAVGPVMLTRPVQAAAIARISPVVASTVIVPMQPRPPVALPAPPSPPPPELPLIETLNGHLLHGWPDSSVMWYVPAFALADDTDRVRRHAVGGGQLG